MQNAISIHLMLLFISAKVYRCHLAPAISIHLMLLFIYAYFQGKPRIVNFNTSHVTVYPGRTQNVRHLNEISIHLMLLFIVKVAGHKDDPLKFQYISCYCLSIPSADIASVTISFQYISCYCLSVMRQKELYLPWYFNTSHVTVYRYSMMLHSPRYSNFNTSHVTVYPVAINIARVSLLFQYISCYCLSIILLFLL